jgi:plasmid stabilization system protein ParE
MRLEFHPDALAEYEAAALYYRGQREGLQLRFVENVENAIERIVENPSAWRRFDGEIRHCLTHVFPYAVLYTIEPDYIFIVAVMHSRREPGYWRNRIS